MRLSIHLKSLLTLIVAIFVFSVVVPFVSAPIPGQLYGWYVITTLFVIYLYVSSSEASWEEFISPVRNLLLARTALTKPLRIVVFIVVPLLFGWYFSTWAAGGATPPGGSRVIHPTPPSSVNFQGKQLVLQDISVSPIREDEAHLAEHVEQGRIIYYENCFFCHGDALQGRGTSPRGSTRRRRIFRPAARSRSCPSRICSGVSPRAGRDCRASRRRGIRPCRSGRTF